MRLFEMTGTADCHCRCVAFSFRSFFDQKVQAYWRAYFYILLFFYIMTDVETDFSSTDVETDFFTHSSGAV